MTTEVNGAAPAGNPSETGNPAAAQTNAATTNPQTDGGEGGEGSPVTKTFNQDEVNDIVRKAKAAAEAKAERRVLRTLEKLQPQQSAPQHEGTQAQKDDKPTPRQGETTDAYLDRLTDWKLDQRDRKAAGERQQEQHRTLAQKTDGIYAEAQKLPGFDREAFDELPLTKSMVEALIDSDNAAKLMHHMAAHPEEVDRIAKLSPARQAAELGKLEATLPAAKKSSNAPDPSGNPAAGAATTSVPGDLSKLPMDKYHEQRKKQGARWAN